MLVANPPVPRSMTQVCNTWAPAWATCLGLACPNTAPGASTGCKKQTASSAIHVSGPGGPLQSIIFYKLTAICPEREPYVRRDAAVPLRKGICILVGPDVAE